MQTNIPPPSKGISYGPQLMQGKLPISTWSTFPFKLIFSSRIDIAHFDNIRHFSCERIPERVLHAKGAAAHGYFTPTKNLSEYTIAHPFQEENLNKKIPVTARFSTVSGEAGSVDTVRTFRGFAIKLKTDVGNWDWGT